jgi:uncharacterized protein YbaA (DUF1428 family)
MYLDGFVAPVPRTNLPAYLDMASRAMAVWMDHGALSAVEAVGDDVPDGVQTSFPLAVKLQMDEVPVFALITYRDRAHRDAVNRAVEADPRMADGGEAPVFDARRMIWGGFNVALSMTAPG